MRKPACLTRSFGHQHFVCVALFVLVLCQLPTICVYGTEATADPYDVIIARKDSTGRAYGTNEEDRVGSRWRYAVVRRAGRPLKKWGSSNL